MFRLASVPDSHFLEIEVLEEADSAYAAGDIRFSISVESDGFTGKAEAWVLRDEIGRFARALRALNSSLRGNAVLRSVSPEQLELEVLAVSSRGHLAVQGVVGKHVFGESRTYLHALHFGFEIEPSQLEFALGEKWVGAHAV